jgi:hypothetical protein
MIKQAEVSKIAYREGISERTIEKDYVITWILLGLVDSFLKNLLAFKGGTAIKKIYFPTYRYSEDIDFTLVGKGDDKSLIEEFRKVLLRLEREVAFTFNISEERIEERKDSLTFYIEFIGPLLAKLGKRDIKVDVTLKEKILFPLEEKPIISSYSDSSKITKNIKTYSLEEILSEKLCALIGRTEPRDLYDTHFLLNLNNLDYLGIKQAFLEKAKSKNIRPERLKTILSEKEKTFARLWEVRLKHQVKELPHFKKVLRETKQLLRRHKLV